MSNEMKKEEPHDLYAVDSHASGVIEPQTTHTIYDAVFGDITEESPNYRNVGWIGTTILMIKTQIGLGVLSIPSVFHQIGLIPGVIAMLLIAGITTWSDYMVGAFKIRHPEVYGVDDVGLLLFGKIGRVVLGATFCIFFAFTAASGLLSISIGLNAVSSHGTCTAVFVGVAAIVVFLFSSSRTLSRISWIVWIGSACLITAILTLTIAVGLQDRPADAPQPPHPWSSDWQLVKKASFQEISSAISSLVFAYAGTGGFFPIASEMRNPRYFTRSLLICQSFITSMYLMVGIVVYHFCGSYVASPALGSAGPLLKKVSYGIALPGLLATTVLPAHITSKYVFVTILRGSKHLASNSLVHWSTWFGCTFIVSLVAYIIASAIPNFGGLISLIGAILGPMLCFLPMGCMWLFDNYQTGKQEPSRRWYAMVAFSIFVLIVGLYIMGTGTYGSIVTLISVYQGSSGGSVWSCADNSDS